jgi:hypothetical protein
MKTNQEVVHEIELSNEVTIRVVSFVEGSELYIDRERVSLEELIEYTSNEDVLTDDDLEEIYLAIESYTYYK